MDGLRWSDLPSEQLAEIIAALRAEGREHQAEAAHALRLADQLEAQLVAARQADRRRRKAEWLTRMRDLGLVAAIGTALGAAARSARDHPSLAPAPGTPPADSGRDGDPLISEPAPTPSRRAPKVKPRRGHAPSRPAPRNRRPVHAHSARVPEHDVPQPARVRVLR